MLSKSMEENFFKEEAPIDLDEGWWSSILADEETISASARPNAGKASSPSPS
jgi:hypothetical protein